MTKLIVAAVILIVIMLMFIFILFKNIIKKMDENAKKYFVNKMQDYDYILEEKQARLEEINSEINQIKEEHKNILQKDEDEEQEETTDKNGKENKKTSDDFIEEEEEYRPKKPLKEVNYNLNVPEYRETQFFNNYKEVREKFTVNNKQIIKDFITEHKNLKEEKEYKALKKLRAKFNEESIYGCLTLSSDDQIKILKDALTETEKKLVSFNKMIEKPDFSIKDLIKFIDNRMEEIDPTIYIYTNTSDNIYESLDSNIVEIEYKNMSEGIIIKYRDKIYDYSI